MSYSFEIVRLRLVNFAHFSDLGLDDFEIDRYGSKNNIITIIGANGSGKSLLITSWSPRPNESTNNRKKTLIVPGKEGLKEVDLLTTDEDGDHGPYLYKCRIIYGEKSTNCSMIRVDRESGEEVELNPSGLVSAYEEILESTFGISKNYKNVGYLSPEITSLISMTPSVRYEYISTWLPDISQYMDAYKAVFKRINSVNRQVRMLENDIGGISIEKVTSDKKMLEVRLKTVNDRIEEFKEVRMRTSIILDGLANVTDDFIRKNIQTISKNRKTLNSHYERLVELSSASMKYLTADGPQKLIDDVKDCENRITIVNSELGNVSRMIEDQRMRLKEVEYTLGMLDDTGDSLPEIGIMMERIEKSILEANKVIENYINSYNFLEELSDNFTINEFNIVYNTIETIIDKCKRITDLVPMEKMDNLSDYSNISDKETSVVNSRLRDIEDRVSKTLERISLLKNSPLDPSILNKIPEWCENLKCGVVLEIKRLLSPDTEVEKLSDVLDDLYRSKSDIAAELDRMSDEHNNIAIAVSHSSDVDHAIMRDKNFIVMLPNHMRNVLSEGIVTIISHVNTLTRDMESIREFISLRDQVKIYVSELKSLKEKESSLRVIRNMNGDILNLNNSIDSLQIERSKLYTEGEQLLKDHSTLKELSESIGSIRDSVNEYNLQVSSFKETNEKMKLICKDWYYREKISKYINQVDINLRNLIIERDDCSREIESLNNSIVTKQSLIDIRDRLLSTIKELDLFQDAWNPKTGIPSLFINNFLTRVHVKSNEYMESLNGKDLKIEKFEIGKTAREFPIIIRKDDSIIPDANQCSAGEKALLSLAISMAVISVASENKPYRVLRLDEMDATLDHRRRKLYIEMIQDRLKEIESRQCLIITHSDEFDEVASDMIIMPGAFKNPESLANKNVLVDLSEISIDSLS